MAHNRAQRRWIVLGSVVLALALLILLWDWNWFRPLVERRASAALDRQVTLQHFDVDLGRHPLVKGEGIVIANPPGFPSDSRFGSIDRLAVRLDLRSLLQRRVRLLEIVAERPLGDLRPGPEGDPNWKFGKGEEIDEDEPGAPVEIGRLVIRNGRIHVLEPRFKADFVLEVRTEEQGGAEPRLRIDAKGTYAGEPIEGRFIGGSVLSLREPDKPYPVDLEAANGPTRISLKGTVQQPLQLGGANLDLKLSGNDMEALYPLTGVPLPPTAAYAIKGKLDYEKKRVRFRRFSGTVGQSDLAGDIEIDLDRPKRLVRANLVSKKIVLADLAGFVGKTPGQPGERGETAKQQRERAIDESRPRVLPDQPINLPRIRAADFDVKYHGQRIESEHMPLDELQVHLLIEDGYVRLKPLRFRVGEAGQIAGNIELDGRKDRVHAVADVDFRRIDLKRLMQETRIFEGAGLIGGTARIDGHGNSMAQLLGSGDGELQLFMNRGELSALLVNLAGLEFGKAVLSLLGLPSRTDIRCMVSDLELKDGLLRTRTLLADTGEANIIVKGTINLQNERLDLKLRTEPKRMGIGSFKAPIEIGGTLKDPDVGVDKSQLAGRGGAAAVLGTLLGPLAALLPTIDLGLGKDHDCRALVDEVRAAAGTPPSLPATAPMPPPPSAPASGEPRRRPPPANLAQPALQLPVPNDGKTDPPSSALFRPQGADEKVD